MPKENGINCTYIGLKLAMGGSESLKTTTPVSQKGRGKFSNNGKTTDMVPKFAMVGELKIENIGNYSTIHRN